MDAVSNAPLIELLRRIDREFIGWLASASFLDCVAPALLREAVVAYPERTGKRMRPAMVMLAAAATGGEEAIERARPVAYALELFHTWTLVHDDIIDRDPVRRGKPTVHTLAAAAGARAPLNLSDAEAAHYGASVAILAGDLQHGWCSDTIIGAARSGLLPSDLTLEILHRLNRRVLTLLVAGEMRDVDYGLLPIDADGDLHEDEVISMLWQKTGALYEFCGETGGLIGLGSGDYNQPQVRALGRFASHLGTAFQLQDDLLGLLGSEKETGKPVGADLREGKRTTLVLRALRTAKPGQIRALCRVLGNKEASAADIAEATAELQSLGCVDHTRRLANDHLHQSLQALSELPPSTWRDSLAQLAEFTVARSR
jgi:geranylgeranyl diphosphate synthase type I